MERTGARLLWGTANLFSHPRYAAGAATNPDPEVFAYAAAQVKLMLEATHRLGRRELRAVGRPRGLRDAAQHRPRARGGAAGPLPDPGRRAQAPDRLRRHPAARAEAAGADEAPVRLRLGDGRRFLLRHGLEDEYRVNIEVNHATLAGHSFHHEVATAIARGIFGSIDVNRGDYQNGWDTDQFPNSVDELALALYEILARRRLHDRRLQLRYEAAPPEPGSVRSVPRPHRRHRHAGARAAGRRRPASRRATSSASGRRRYAGWTEGLGAEILGGGRVAGRAGGTRRRRRDRPAARSRAARSAWRTSSTRGSGRPTGTADRWRPRPRDRRLDHRHQGPPDRRARARSPAIGTAEYGYARPAPLLERAGPATCGGTAHMAAIRAGAGRRRRRRRGGRRRRLAGPDARRGPARRRPTGRCARRSCGTTSAPAAECDDIRRRGRAAAADRDHRQRRAHRLHGAEAASGSATTSRTCGAGSPTCCCRRTTSAFSSPATTRSTRPMGPARCCSTSPARDWSAEVLAALEHRPGLAARGPSRGPRSPASSRRRGRGHRPARRARRSWPAAATRRPTAVGVGAVDPGIVALSLGTSGVVFAATDRPLFEPRGRVHAFCHAVPDRWHLMSVMLSAAGSLRWFRDALAPGVPFADARRGGRPTSPAGSDGLCLPPLPHRRAQPAPGPARPRRVRRPDREPRAAPPDACRARGRGVWPARRPRPDGGGRHAGTDPDPRIGRRASPARLWRQILADVLGAEIATVSTTEGAAYGAASLRRSGRAGSAPSTRRPSAGRSSSRSSPSPGPDASALRRGAMRLYRDAVPGAGAHLPRMPPS